MNLANNLTILRILLVPAFIISLTYYSPQQSYLLATGAVIFIVACFTDALDGYVARKYHQQSTLGSYIDPVADKLLLISAFLCLSFMPNLPPATKIPAWVTISVISRDVLILIGWVMLFIMSGNVKSSPLIVSKITTVVQMMTLFSSLLSWPHWLQRSFFILTLFFTLLSGILYVKKGTHLLSVSVNGAGASSNGRKPLAKP